MKTSDAGLDLIKKFEGVRFEAYDDGIGIATIGVGHTNGVQFGDRATTEEVDQWLREDLEDAENAVNLSLVGTDLTQNQFDALVSLAFNIGGGAFNKSTLVRKLKAGLMEDAADQFLVWNKAGGHVMKGLQNRRIAEREMFLGLTS
jgi:lysozyme